MAKGDITPPKCSLDVLPAERERRSEIVYFYLRYEHLN